MSTKLKTCPFCGAKPKLRNIIEHYDAGEDGPSGSYDAWGTVNCDDCGIEIGDEQRVYAETSWNKRARRAKAEGRTNG